MFASGDLIVRQHDKAAYAFFLQHGRVQVMLSLQDRDDFVIETLTESAPMLGWSVFRPPYRYTSSIRCETACQVLAIPRTAFERVISRDATLEPLLLSCAAVVVAERLERTQDVLVGRSGAAPRPVVPATTLARQAVTARDRSVLAESPFFESCTASELELLAERASVVMVPAGASLFHRGADADLLHMLVDGRVQLLLVEDDEEPPTTTPSSQTISEAGRVVGWSALVAPFRYRTGAVALTRCRSVVFRRADLTALMNQHPALGTALMHQLLAVLGNRLRETRMWAVARRYDDELVAIRSLIDQNAEALSVTSPLHKLPLFLENRITMPDAFHAMELLAAHGDELERTLARSCLDLMASMQREGDIYGRLQAIYQHVAAASDDTPPSEVRRLCAEEFQLLFDKLRYEIRGQELLPDAPGHLFIMNHLTNHDENLLPNGFRLTMDTHFVSSMIVFPKYGAAPIRVIRRPFSDEYAHQMYYERLDYISVYRAHLDPVDLAEGEDTLARRRAFLDDAEARLGRGENIVICPEGDCTSTENSPLPLRSGAFRLALYIQSRSRSSSRSRWLTSTSGWPGRPSPPSCTSPFDSPISCLRHQVKLTSSHGWASSRERSPDTSPRRATSRLTWRPLSRSGRPGTEGYFETAPGNYSRVVARQETPNKRENLDDGSDG